MRSLLVFLLALSCSLALNAPVYAHSARASYQHVLLFCANACFRVESPSSRFLLLASSMRNAPLSIFSYKHVFLFCAHDCLGGASPSRRFLFLAPRVSSSWLLLRRSLSALPGRDHTSMRASCSPLRTASFSPAQGRRGGRPHHLLSAAVLPAALLANRAHLRLDPGARTLRNPSSPAACDTAAAPASPLPLRSPLHALSSSLAACAKTTPVLLRTAPRSSLLPPACAATADSPAWRYARRAPSLRWSVPWDPVHNTRRSLCRAGSPALPQRAVLPPCATPSASAGAATHPLPARPARQTAAALSASTNGIPSAIGVPARWLATRSSASCACAPAAHALATAATPLGSSHSADARRGNPPSPTVPAASPRPTRPFSPAPWQTAGSPRPPPPPLPSPIPPPDTPPP